MKNILLYMISITALIVSGCTSSREVTSENLKEYASSKDTAFAAGESKGIFCSSEDTTNQMLGLQTDTLLNKEFSYPFNDTINQVSGIPPDTVVNKENLRLLFQILPNDNETAVGFGVEDKSGLYRMIIPIVSTVVIYQDPNYENKVNASYTCLFSIGALMVGGMIHSDEVVDARSTILTILAVPVILANSEHHLMLIDAEDIEASVFGNSRADIFNKWWKYNMGAGLHLGLRTSGSKISHNENIFVFQFGYQKALFGNGIYDKNWKFYGGLSYAFATN